MTIRMNLKRTTGKSTTIRAIIRLNGKKSTLSTGVKVDTGDWDRKREKCKSNNLVNKQIEEIRTQITEYIQEHGKPPGKQEIEQVSNDSIIGAIDEVLKKMQATNAPTNSMKSYKSLKNLINRYSTDNNRRETKTNEITKNYIEGFGAWMVKENYASGTIDKMTQTLKSVTKEKTKSKVWDHIDKPRKQTGETIYLTSDEIKLIETVQLDNHLDKARDIFLIGCYTALRFSDWIKVDQTRIQTIDGVQVMTINQQKTRTQITLPITQRLRTIMDKYRHKTPRLSNKTTNKNIKEVCRLAGITQRVSISEYKGGKEIITTQEKYKFVSTHTARRSFATNAMLAGIPISEVMKFTGHKSISSFFTYIRTTGQETAIKYAKHPFFN